MGSRVFCVAVGLLALGWVGFDGLDGQAVELARGDSVEALIHAALESEIAGDSQQRNKLLQEAIKAEPENRLARWHAGQVCMEDQWLSVDEVQRRWADDERLAEYRRLRDRHAGTPAGELALARWCRNRKLDVEERIHWLKVVLYQPLHEEALKNLELRWYGGELLTHDQIEQRRAEVQQANRERAARPNRSHWTQHWNRQLAKWKRAIENEDPDVGQSMQEALLAVEFSEGIEVLDALVHQQFQSAKKSDRQTCQTLDLELIGAFDAIRQPWAMHALSRHAVYHPAPDIREAAADALKNRSQETVVPWLLARMRWPTEASFVLVTHPDGSVTYRHSFYREGLDADFRENHDESTYLGSMPLVIYDYEGHPDRDRRQERQEAEMVQTLELSKKYLTSWAAMAQSQASNKAVVVQRQMEAAYARDSQFNRRIHAVLSHVTGADLKPHPKDWNQWWNARYQDYYEMEKQEVEKTPVYERRVSNTRRLYTAPAVTSPYTPLPSCFPQGTKIWTLTGPMDIEKIKPGDRVLSQDPRSGELAYKPVLQTTVRDPSPMVKIGLGSETIVATRGHPFWVSGEGWRMAKELEPGLPLHGVSGARCIDHLEETPPAEAWYDFSYNLIVDDFHTYFVGDSRVLVHDNRLYIHDNAPATSPLPGLAAR